MNKIEVSLPITVKELASITSVKSNDLIVKLMDLGEEVSINTILEDKDTVTLVANEFDCDVKFKKKSPQKKVSKKEKKSKKLSGNEKERAPVVTFMGHVDHGKTSLLDYIRNARVVAGESGGITQHIGAYSVTTEKGRVVFLDTPGHKSFTEMRARGATVADIVVLVVAADDGLMPQTLEAIDHCKAADVPIIVAINKIDLASANVDNVKRQLSEKELTPEDWGGSVITCAVSAKTGDGIDALLEMILLQAEIMELTADPRCPAKGVVIESRLTKIKGPVATVLIQEGTLCRGDSVVSGMVAGKIKAMVNEQGILIKEAPSSTPVEILGLSGVPLVGSKLFVVGSDKEAKERISVAVDEDDSEEEGTDALTLEDLYARISEGNMKELKLIIKADVTGSVEAISAEVATITSDEVKIKIIRTGTGDITENDIMLASASDAIVIGFHVKINQAVTDIAKREGVDVRLYAVIYELLDEIGKSLEGLLEPKYKEVLKAHAVVKQLFKVSKVGKVAGCFVENGKIFPKDHVRVIRDDVIIFNGKIGTLKRFKNDVKEVVEGQECGINIASFEKLQEGDHIETYELLKEKRKT
ncbi:translation initiation factor IF-2 [Chlamydiota bacterium]